MEGSEIGSKQCAEEKIDAVDGAPSLLQSARTYPMTMETLSSASRCPLPARVDCSKHNRPFVHASVDGRAAEGPQWVESGQ